MALGDILCTFPAALQLKKRHPNASVIYLCRKLFHCLPRLGGVSEYVVWFPYTDILKNRYSFLFTAIYRFTYSDELPDHAPTESVIEEYCRQHDVPIVQDHPRLHFGSDLVARAKSILERHKMSGRPIIAIHPGPTWPVREWPGESWNQLVNELNRRGFKNIVQLGAGRPGALGTALDAAIPNVLSLVNALSMEEAIGLISLCDLFVGIDSGLLHAAICVRTPSVGIFGATSPQFRFSTAVAQLFVVSKESCQGCHHRPPRLHWDNGCPNKIACMKSITVNDVLQACLSGLDAQTEARQINGALSEGNNSRYFSVNEGLRK